MNNKLYRIEQNVIQENNTVVTCEIKYWYNFEIISVFYFTCNHGWNSFKII